MKISVAIQLIGMIGIWLFWGCKSIQDDLRDGSQSELTAMVSDHFSMHVAEQPHNHMRMRFEVCLWNSEIASKCVNAIRVSNKASGARNEPFHFSARELKRSELAPEVQSILVERQESLLRFQSIKHQAKLSGWGGAVAVLFGLNNIMLRQGNNPAVQHLKNLPPRWRLGSAVLLFTAGVLLVEHSIHLGEQEEILQDNIDYYDDLFRKRVPYSFGEDPKKWLLVLENYSDFSKSPQETQVKVAGFVDYLKVFASYLEVIGFVSWQKGNKVTGLCFPYSEDSQVMQAFKTSWFDGKTRAVIDPDRVDCPVLLPIIPEA